MSKNNPWCIMTKPGKPQVSLFFLIYNNLLQKSNLTVRSLIQKITYYFSSAIEADFEN